MRHLRKYNELIDISEQEIEDICLELKDLGYTINIEKHEDFTKIICSKLKDMGANVFPEFIDVNWNEVKDCFLRLQDYVGYRYIGFYYKTREFHNFGDKRTNTQYIPLNEDTKIDASIKLVAMKYENYEISQIHK